MSMQEKIRSKIEDALAPMHLEVTDESHMHNVPEGAESHFKVVVVSSEFQDTRLLDRHRRVNTILAEELKGSVHALAVHTLTPEEWFTRGGAAPSSPECMGGSKAGGAG